MQTGNDRNNSEQFKRARIFLIQGRINRKYYLKILGTRKVTWSTFHSADPKTLGVTLQNSVARVILCPAIVYRWCKHSNTVLYIRNVTPVCPVIYQAFISNILRRGSRFKTQQKIYFLHMGHNPKTRLFVKQRRVAT